MEHSKYCQSCGMPHKKDEMEGGTNADGSKSLKYCSHCYQMGEFQNPEINTVKKMQDFVRRKVESQGVPCFLSGFFTKGIPKLERWNY